MDEVAEVKSRLEIAEVVGAYVPLKQAGRNLKAPCPFHQEKTASFMVSPEKGIYHCFGCGEGGDIFNFVMKMEGLDFRAALELLARKAGVELQERSGDGGAMKRLKGRLYEAHELAVKYFQANLLGNKKALDYVVKKRKLGKGVIRDFQIGYAPDTWEGLTSALLKKGFTPKELLQGGLAGQRDGRNSIYDLFRGRVMFALCDREGRPVGFTGRVLDNSEPKYYNTPQTPLFDKSQVIFGLHLAKDAIRKTDEVVLVEGQMDVVASHQAGVGQVVATSGTALTVDHLRTLSKLTKNIKLAFDSDRAGLAATERAIEMGQKLGLTLRMVELPDGIKDADELIQAEGMDAWADAISQAKYIVDYLFDRFERDFDLTSGMGKRGYTDRLVGSLRRLGDPVEQDHYVKLLSQKTGTSGEAVRAKLAQGEEQDRPAKDHNTLRRRPQPREQAVTTDSTPARSDSQPVRRAVTQAVGRPGSRRLLEESLLGLMLLEPSSRAAARDLEESDFSDPQRQALLVAILKAGGQPGAKVVAGLTEDKDYGNIILLRGEQEFEVLAPADRSIEAFGLARRLQTYANTEHKQALNKQLREAEENGDGQLVRDLLKRYKALLEEEV